jgi:hypothetical protein
MIPLHPLSLRSRGDMAKYAIALVRSLSAVVSLSLIVACRAREPEAGLQTRSVAWRMADSAPLGSADSTSAPPCTGTKDDSDPIPFTVVDLGPAVATDIPVINGPEGRAVVATSAEWTRVWDVLTDSIPLPTVNLHDSVVLIAATQQYSSGPVHLRFERVRLCRGRSEIVAQLRVHAKTASNDYPARALTAIELSRQAVAGRSVRFVDLLPGEVER